MNSQGWLVPVHLIALEYVSKDKDGLIRLPTLEVVTKLALEALLVTQNLHSATAERFPAAVLARILIQMEAIAALLEKVVWKPILLKLPVAQERVTTAA